MEVLSHRDGGSKNNSLPYKPMEAIGVTSFWSRTTKSDIGRGN